MRTKTITITGISGANTKEFCAKYAQERENVKVYSTSDLIYKLAQNIPPEPPFLNENLLNLNPKFLNSLRDLAFDNMIDDIRKEKENYKRIVIDTHAQFFWNDVFHNAYNWRYLNEIDSDLFITLIDKPSSIKQRQLETEKGRIQEYDFRDLLLWQNMEINVTKGWAENLKKPMYILPNKQNPQIIENLLDNHFLIYFQMPMTEASSEANDMISQFKEKVLQVGKDLNKLPTPLIDPRDIDMEQGSGLSNKIERTIRRHTVHRDLNWYISEATDLIAFYPPGTNISIGVSYETKEGFETGKNAFVVFPKENTSPFMDAATKVFRTEEEFFDFFPNYMKKRIERFKRN
ncbi:MAG: AAA family ATPase [Nanoarchaeota archaeon]|nr:AAA family ATPase [Nanoarchaeota archaeon]